jgi:hypothetical protein
VEEKKNLRLTDKFPRAYLNRYRVFSLCTDHIYVIDKVVLVVQHSNLVISYLWYELSFLEVSC